MHKREPYGFLLERVSSEQTDSSKVCSVWKDYHKYGLLKRFCCKLSLRRNSRHRIQVYLILLQFYTRGFWIIVYLLAESSQFNGGLVGKGNLDVDIVIINGWQNNVHGARTRAHTCSHGNLEYVLRTFCIVFFYFRLIWYCCMSILLTAMWIKKAIMPTVWK